MDRCEAREIVQSDFLALIGMDADLRFASTGLATATLVVFLLCSTRESLAQTGSAGGGVGVTAATAVLVSSGVTGGVADVLPVPDAAAIRRVRELDGLLAVRGGSPPITARQTDQAIAAAVARGHAKELDKPKAFRKRSDDLFRAQRAVQIGNQEMQVRLRMRAKTRNAMSVELRF